MGVIVPTVFKVQSLHESNKVRLFGKAPLMGEVSP